MNSTYRCPEITGFAKIHVISDTQNFVVVTFLGALIPITIMANASLAFALIKTKQIVKHPSHIFIFLLCLSDMFVGAISIPFDIIIFLKFRHIRFCKLELAATFIQIFNTKMSAYIIAVMVLHIHIKVNPDFKELSRIKKWLVSRTGSVFLLVVAFLLAVGHGLSANYSFGNYHKRTPSWMFKGIDCVLLVTVFFAVR